jgi:hypothetical protein
MEALLMTPTTTVRYVTGSEAGLSGADQIRIALKTIVQNGGMAQTSKITKAMEDTLRESDPNLRLSDQGKASLRFFVNKVAVNSGYIHKYDPKKPGWYITAQGREQVTSTTKHQLTPIGQDFQLALSDVYTLLNADEKLSHNNPVSTAAFVRAGIILTVTAWETFIEDTLKALFQEEIAHATKPEDVLSAFNTVAAAWINRFAVKQKYPNIPELAKWSGDGWKAQVIEHFNEHIANFNTPNSRNIIDLFKRYIDSNIKTAWQWEGMKPDDACKKLDDLVKVRGALVHRGRTNANPMPDISREQLITMITLVDQLVWATDVEFNFTTGHLLVLN